MHCTHTNFIYHILHAHALLACVRVHVLYKWTRVTQLICWHSQGMKTAGRERGQCSHAQKKSTELRDVESGY